jgi:capsular exopolysaccharide synthesis family protein
MDLRQYLHAVRTYWWVIAIPAALGLVLGVVASARAVPQYRASMKFFITTTSVGADTQDAVQGDQFAQRRVNSYAKLLDTDVLADRVIEAADLDLTRGQIKAMVGGHGDIDTVILTATVTHEDRDLAEKVAGAVAIELIGVVDEVESTAERPSSASLELIDGPNVSQLPVKKTITIGLRTALGLMLGVGIALLLELRDNTIRSDDQLPALGLSPVLGMIPLDRHARFAPLIVDEGSQSIRSEAFRKLRTSLEFIDVEKPVRVLVITSSVGEEGKSTTAANLALSLFLAGRRVLLIDADLRRPTLNSLFKLSSSVGLSDVIIGRARPEDVMQPWRSDDLMVLPTGLLPPNPSELLASDSMRRLLTRLRPDFDVIIIDSPPLLPVTDAAVLAPHADGVVVVVRSARTTRHQLALSMRSLNAVGARVLGAVMNMVPVKQDSYTTYSYSQTPGQGAPRVVDPRPGSETPETVEVVSAADRVAPHVRGPDRPSDTPLDSLLDDLGMVLATDSDAAEDAATPHDDDLVSHVEGNGDGEGADQATPGQRQSAT